MKNWDLITSEFKVNQYLYDNIKENLLLDNEI